MNDLTIAQPPTPAALQDANGKKIAAGICGILVGSFGIHKFILGMNTAGLIMLFSTVLTCGLAAVVFHFVGLIEGIMYLTKSDEEFYRVYIVGKKEWL
jgi:TM2 domain-containing membrane protein YozV